MKPEAQKHTPGPWSYTEADGFRGPSGQLLACIIDSRSTTTVEQEANAERIVACVNACEGIADPSCVPEMLRVAGRILAAHESGNNGMIMGEAVLCPYFATALKYLIDKAEGRA